MKYSWMWLSCLALGLTTPLAMANAPVVAAAPALPTQQYTNLKGSNLTFDQKYHFLSKLNNLQKEVQELRGLIELQQHQLQLFQQQQMALHAALEKRLAQQQPAAPTKAVAHTGIGVTTQAPASTQSDQQHAQEEKAYQAAYQHVLNKQYTTATTALQQFLRDYPHGRYVANTHYWLGELAVLRDDTATAKTEFNTVITIYPNSAKASDAWFKLGYVYLLEHNTNRAKQIFQSVIQRYPNTNAAKLAKAKLTALAKAGK